MCSKMNLHEAALAMRTENATRRCSKSNQCHSQIVFRRLLLPPGAQRPRTRTQRREEISGSSPPPPVTMESEYINSTSTGGETPEHRSSYRRLHPHLHGHFDCQSAVRRKEQGAMARPVRPEMANTVPSIYLVPSRLNESKWSATAPQPIPFHHSTSRALQQPRHDK